MTTIETMADTIKLLGDKTRLTIVGLLKERELCVCDIVDTLQMSQPSISQHLRKMKAGGLLNEHRRGKWVYYSLNLNERSYLNEIIERIPSQAEKIEMLVNKEAVSVCD